MSTREPAVYLRAPPRGGLEPAGVGVRNASAADMSPAAQDSGVVVTAPAAAAATIGAAVDDDAGRLNPGTGGPTAEEADVALAGQLGLQSNFARPEASFSSTSCT